MILTADSAVGMNLLISCKSFARYDVLDLKNNRIFALVKNNDRQKVAVAAFWNFNYCAPIICSKAGFRFSYDLVNIV